MPHLDRMLIERDFKEEAFNKYYESLYQEILHDIDLDAMLEEGLSSFHFKTTDVKADIKKDLKKVISDALDREIDVNW